MFGLRKGSHAGEIPLREVHADLPHDAFEIARFWLNSERSYVSIAFKREWPPELLGSLFVEGLQTAADAYSEAVGMQKDQVLELIWQGVDEERERLSSNSKEGTH